MPALDSYASVTRANVNLKQTLGLLLGVQVLFGAIAMMTSWVVVLAPLLALIGITAVLAPRAGLYLLAVSLFLRVDMPGTNGVFPGDIVALLLIAGLTLHVATHTASMLKQNSLLAPLATMMVVFLISLLGAFDPVLGLKNWFRHLQMIFVILAASEVLEADDIWKLSILILALSVTMTIPTVIEFIRVGGRQRVFGIGYLFMPFYLATGIMFCAVGYLLQEARFKRLLYAACAIVLAMGIIASQTREAMLHAAIGVILTIALIWHWAVRVRAYSVRRRAIVFATCSAVALTVFLFGSVETFQTAAGRVYQAVEGRSNTIAIRLFLWKTGIEVFSQSPVIGIGLAQNSQWSKFVESWHFDPMSQLSKGIGSHNDLITYGAETGILGLAALFWFFSRIITTGHREYRRAHDVDTLQLLLIVWIPCLATFGRFFYGTHTFYSLGGLFNCLYFGMLIALTRSQALRETTILRPR